MSPRYPVRQRPSIHRSSFREWREDGDRASIETRPFWRWFDAPGFGENVDAATVLTPEEFRVLSKGASGGGFLVPTDLAESVHAAARAASPIGLLATEFPTQRGDTFNVSLAGTHGSASWIAESGSYAASDETITNAALAAHKAGTKIIVSEELRTDEATSMDDFLGAELGGRLGALQETAFTVGDGSGKPANLITLCHLCHPQYEKAARTLTLPVDTPPAHKRTARRRDDRHPAPFRGPDGQPWSRQWFDY